MTFTTYYVYYNYLLFCANPKRNSLEFIRQKSTSDVSCREKCNKTSITYISSISPTVYDIIKQTDRPASQLLRSAILLLMSRNSPGVNIARWSYSVKKTTWYQLRARTCGCTHALLNHLVVFFSFFLSPRPGTTQFPHPQPLADNSKSYLRHYSLVFVYIYIAMPSDVETLASWPQKYSEGHTATTRIRKSLSSLSVLADVKHLQMLRLYLQCKRRLTYKPRVSKTAVDFLVSGKHQYRLHCNF